MMIRAFVRTVAHHRENLMSSRDIKKNRRRFLGKDIVSLFSKMLDMVREHSQPTVSNRSKA
jgi:hypothetical protein